MGIPCVIINKNKKQYIKFECNCPDVYTIHSKYKIAFIEYQWSWSDEIVVDECCFNDLNELITSDNKIKLLDYQIIAIN